MSHNKPTLVILNSNYPSKENLYGDVFVHSRLKYYLSDFHIIVIGYRPWEVSRSYEYEGITVFNHASKADFVADITSKKPDVIGIHFVGGWYYDAFLKNLKIPVVIWIHGEEALGWYRRLYYFNLKSLHKLAVFAAKNVYQLYHVRRIINLSNKSGNIKFVFVSNWMKTITETDTATNIRHYSIIPNPIDTTLFQFAEKDQEQAKKVLLIRSFESKKYANDIAMKAISILKDKAIFNSLQFEIYGKGKFWDKLTAPVKTLPNVKLHNHFLENHQIPLVHKGFGIFLCPTRQDAQGVSMCEAMSSGLVPITSNNTAIPEFVKDKETGYLTNSAEEVAAAIEQLATDLQLRDQMARNASTSIKEKAGHSIVIAAELKILTEGLHNRNEFS